MILLSQLDQGVINDFRQVLDVNLDFYPLVNSAAQRWESKNLKFAVTIEPGPAHQGRCRAVGHLIDNAAKFSPPSGQINILLRENGGCNLTVMNQGPSIPKALHEKVFERFYQDERVFTVGCAGVGGVDCLSRGTALGRWADGLS